MTQPVTAEEVQVSEQFLHFLHLPGRTGACARKSRAVLLVLFTNLLKASYHFWVVKQ